MYRTLLARASAPKTSAATRYRVHLSQRQLSRTPSARADPYLLPHTPEHVQASQRNNEAAEGGIEVDVSAADVPYPKPLERTGESTATKRARLVYQSRKRGTRETELLLSTFAQEHLAAMSADEMTQFDKLMDEPDWDIYYWATGKKTPPARWSESAVLEKLKKHAKNEGRVVRRMPEL
ncbi:DUF339-domain-containing protein [Punctularia strigosozonata HHB-11173 SS5]|uniref:DUF339-domain-containing protein n=1 Tax=Punctularia strigosozonata (strain HHB-11173) TaxID=741275 RepID=UPI000441652C|nr:DUF339-domain-containing protein [Punctularia strigosozonata HHB-11173 SS5]EIN08365.1 DUF339-domain-containing protein [Punctularia strigosozonata HHB-11173 SS5]